MFQTIEKAWLTECSYPPVTPGPSESAGSAEGDELLPTIPMEGGVPAPIGSAGSQSAIAGESQAQSSASRQTVYLGVLKWVFDHCGDSLPKAAVATELGISRSHLDTCVDVLEERGLLSRLTPYPTTNKSALSRMLLSQQFFLPNPKAAVRALNNQSFIATMSGMARLRLFIWSLLRTVFPGGEFHFWKTKEGKVLDFVFDYEPGNRADEIIGSPPAPHETAAIQCVTDGEIDPSAFATFRRQQPSAGFNYVVLSNPKARRGKQVGDYRLGGFADALATAKLPPGPERIKRQQEWLYQCRPVELVALLHFKEMPPVIKNETLVRSCLEEAPTRRRGKVASTQKQKSFRVTQKLQHEFLLRFFMSEYSRALKLEPDLTLTVHLKRIAANELQTDESLGRSPT